MVFATAGFPSEGQNIIMMGTQGGVDDMTFSDREDVLSMDDDEDEDSSSDDYSGSSCSDDSSDWSSDEDDELMEEMLAETMKFLPRTASSPAVMNFTNIPKPLVDQETIRKKSLMRADSVSNMLQPMNAAPASLIARIQKAEFVMGDSTLVVQNKPSSSVPSTTPALVIPPPVTQVPSQKSVPQVTAAPVKVEEKPDKPSERPTAAEQAKKSKKHHHHNKNPQEHFLHLLHKNKAFKKARPVPFTSLLRTFFLEMTDDHVSGYDMPKAAALRTEDVAGFRMMLEKGQNLQVCNRFGESIVHAICRRGSDKLLQFFIDEAKVSLRVVDDYGRNVLHDACWTARPHFDLVKRIITQCPDLLLIEDKRNNTPLHYVRREHWGLWNHFLDEHIDMLAPRDILSHK